MKNYLRFCTKKNYSTLVYKRIGYFNDPEYIPVSHNIAVLIFPPKKDILSCYFHMSLKAIQKACIRLVFLRNINLYTEKPSKHSWLLSANDVPQKTNNNKYQHQLSIKIAKAFPPVTADKSDMDTFHVPGNIRISSLWKTDVCL